MLLAVCLILRDLQLTSWVWHLVERVADRLGGRHHRPGSQGVQGFDCILARAPPGGHRRYIRRLAQRSGRP
jgi:hypothetical protein